MNEITIIPLNHSPRKIQHIKLRQNKIHKSNPVIIPVKINDSTYRMYCNDCGVYLKASKVKEHRRK